MVVMINGEPLLVCSTTKKLFEDFPDLARKGKTLSDVALVRTVKKDGSIEGQEKEEKVRALYVRQTEFAVIPGDDELIDIVGSGWAYTCHIVVLYHSASDSVAVAHFDLIENVEHYLKVIVEKLVYGYQDQSIDVYAIGGVVDEKLTQNSSRNNINDSSLSVHLSLEILKCMMKMKHTFNIKHWLCCEKNTTKGSDDKLYANVQSLYWDRRTKSVHNAEFDFGYDHFLRKGPYLWQSKELMRDLYNSALHKLTIKAKDLIFGRSIRVENYLSALDGTFINVSYSYKKLLSSNLR